MEEKDKNEFGVWLKRTLKEKGILQSELAKMTNIDSPLISRWIHGTVKPRMSMLEKVVEALDCHIEYVPNGHLYTAWENWKMKNLLEIKNRRIEELEERVAIMMEGNGYVKGADKDYTGDVCACGDPAEGRGEHEADGGTAGRESGNGEPDEGGGV